MYQFKVEGISCQGCVKSINNVLSTMDPNVKLTADIEGQILHVDSSKPKEQVILAIEDAGFPVLSSKTL